MIIVKMYLTHNNINLTQYSINISRLFYFSSPMGPFETSRGTRRRGGKTDRCTPLALLPCRLPHRASAANSAVLLTLVTSSAASAEFEIYFLIFEFGTKWRAVFFFVR